MTDFRFCSTIILTLGSLIACVPAIASDHSAVSELINAKENLSHKTSEEIFSKPVVCDPLPDYSSRDRSIAAGMALDREMWLKLTDNLKLEPAWIAWHKRVF
ncbi:MAG: hypothetical protein KGS72_03820 [Cyanobacteria bacterium REEB67]|nr:hypothetical protein [Cyanobacteria bacterium REEB67]